MQLLIVFISYLIIHSTCFERHPLIIRSFLYCTYSLQLSVLLPVCGTVLLFTTCFERHPLIIRSFLYCTYSLQLSVLLPVCGTVLLFATCFERHPLIIRSFLSTVHRASSYLYCCLSVALSCCLQQDSATDRQQHR
jgi:hypothetical protein